MSWEAWFTLAVIITVLVLLARERVPPSVAMSGGMVAVLLAGIVTPEQALSGFSNAAPLTVAALFVLARAVEKTGVMAPVVSAALGRTRGRRAQVARLMAPVAASSAFLNNTPIVAMLLPQVSEWSARNRQSASRLLMPLSFAAILGGVVTVIGTSTNLVVSGLIQEAGYDPIGFFEIGKVGLPLCLVGLAVAVLWAPIGLKERRPAVEEPSESPRQFAFEMRVEPGPLEGKTVEEAGLRNLAGVFLASIERGGELHAPVAPDDRLRAGDYLRFAGRAGDVVDLQGIRGLAPASSHLHPIDASRYFEAVVGATSPLVGSTLKDSGFRARYQAAVIAIHRAGEEVDAKLGEVPLRVGDTLLILADTGFQARWRDQTDFLVIAPFRAAPPQLGRRAWLVGVIGLGLIFVASIGLLPILQASLLAAVALVAFGILRPGEARASLDLDVIVTIAAAFGVAAAAQESGLAEKIAEVLVGALGGFGGIGILAGVIVAAMVLTAVVSNNAAALLMVPIGGAAAVSAGLDPRGFFIAIAVAASIDFMTPIGYQTNTMVWGPGGYRFSDYPRFGFPLTIASLITMLVVVPVAWPL
ncbi:MAG TPA: SLC13 family permease [Acidimicrobiia bacterium]|jgi:di/tricarboxylate transporter